MERDDLFTHIHQAIRLGLMDVIGRAGATDWHDRAEVEQLGRSWKTLRALLDSHSHHEDRHVFPLLAHADPGATRALEAEHRELDSVLADLSGWLDRLVEAPTADGGLALYRELTLFAADYLRHLHDEETNVMDRIWDLCSDDAIATARAALLADTPPDVMATAIELMLRATNTSYRLQWIGAMAATAPAEVVLGVLDTADRVLDAETSARLREAAAIGAPGRADPDRTSRPAVPEPVSAQVDGPGRRSAIGRTSADLTQRRRAVEATLRVTRRLQ